MSGAGYGGAYGGGTGYGGGGGFDGGGAGYGGGGYGGAGYGGGGGYGGAGYGGGGATGGGGGGGYMDNASGAGGGTYGAIDTMQAVTIKQVQDAANDASDDKFVINGTTANQVTFVARILKADVQMTMISLNLDDGTAVIDGSYMLPADEDAATREFAVQKRERIRDGAWVRVVGAIQLVAASRRISIYRVRAVDDHNEIVYHRLDVVRTFLAQTRPRGKTSVATGGALPNGAAPKMDVGAALGAVNDGLGLNPMQRAVFEYVKERFDEGNTRGIDIADIARDIAGVGSINAVREIMEHLASDGHVYATVDENHYAYCRV